MTHAAPLPDDLLAMKQELAQPIAAALLSLTQAGDPAARIRDLSAVGEVALRTLATWLLADYIGGPRDEKVESAITRLVKPSLGDWSALLHHLCRALRARPTCFIPDAPAWLLTPTGKPTPAATAIRAFVELRNDMSHGRVATGTHADLAAVARLEDLIGTLIRSLAWTRGYRMARVLRARVRGEGTFEGQILWYCGPMDLITPRPASWRGWLPDGEVFLVNPAGDARLVLTPFVAVHRHEGKGVDALFVLDALDGLVEAVLDHPARPEPRRVSYTELSPARGGVPREARSRPLVDLSGTLRAGSEPALPTLDIAPPGRAERSPAAPRQRGAVVAAAGIAALAVTAFLVVPTLTASAPRPAPAAATAALVEAPSGHETPDDCPDARTLEGEWTLTTLVLGARPERPKAIGVKGRYILDVQRVGCALTASLRKTGYTQRGEWKPAKLFDRQPLARAPDGTFRARFELGEKGVPDAQFAFVASGDALGGFWNYEGASWVKARYYGVLEGRRGRHDDVPVSSPAGQRCDIQCLVTCAAVPVVDPGGLPPQPKPGLAACLDDCARAPAAEPRVCP